MQAINTEQKRAAETYTNAVGALSEVAFSSAERLTALNQQLARAALQDCLAVSNELFAVRDVNALQNLQSSAAKPALAQFAEYLRSVQEVAAESQQKVGEILKAHFETLGLGSAAGASVQTGIDMLSRLTRQTTDMMNANVEAAGETGDRLARQTKDMMDTSVKAAGDAGDKLAASVTQHSKKAS